MKVPLWVVGSIIAVGVVAALVGTVYSDRVFFRVKTAYPWVYALIGGSGRFNWASSMWLWSGEYKTLKDPQIDRWARVANAMSVVFFSVVALFFALFLYGLYRAHALR